MALTLLEFVRKWNASQLTERSASQQHFRDLCDALGVPHPTEVDEIGNNFSFDKPVTKLSGGLGFVDVWKRNFFGWEYKSKGGDLKAAYKQLANYHEDLENPALLVVCDFVRFEVHTKFENAPTRVYQFTLDDLLNNRDTPTCALPPVEVLRALFTDYNVLRPDRTAARVTRAAAGDLLRLATRLEIETRSEPLSREEIARFLMRIVFCLFADSIGLLPKHVFRDLVLSDDRFSPKLFRRKLQPLFQAMSEKDGIFGSHTILHFNGDLFNGEGPIELDLGDLGVLASAAGHDWSHIEPTIFGTLFERSLDAAKRSLIGAHYTSTEDILLLVDPVVMAPLERRWAAVRAEAEAALTAEPKDATGLPLDRPALRVLTAWVEELATVRVLDPACGSGNFLYVALRRLLDLWYEAQLFATEHRLALLLEPMPSPAQLFGIETDFYAHEIASVVVWIGFLQWKHEHTVVTKKQPLLKKLTNIEKGDAILRYDAEGKPYEPEWPAAEFVVGNPPFLGGTLMKGELGDAYCDDLRQLYKDRVKGPSDLVVYWFEKARKCVAENPLIRVGLVATQGIRGGANQHILQRILDTGTIFYAISDKRWPLDGAMVHISMVAFAGSTDVDTILLDGEPVRQIHSDLSSGLNMTLVSRLFENKGICFRGTEMHGAFDLGPPLAGKMLNAPANPNGRTNTDVVKRYINAMDITQHDSNRFVIDFGIHMLMDEAALYELPFEYIKHHVLPNRLVNRRETRKARWWLHGEPNPGLRSAIKNLKRYVATPRVSKHRVFAWVDSGRLPDSALCVFAREDDYFFGVLHSSAHEAWARAMGTQLREVESGFRYTPKSTFDTFPFPCPPGTEPVGTAAVEAIAEAARELVRLRDAWLNPPGISEAELKDKTLTKLYNQRPTWLDNAHRTLDRAVFRAYGWPDDISRSEVLARLLALNEDRAAAQSTSISSRNDHSKAAQRHFVRQVLE